MWYLLVFILQFTSTLVLVGSTNSTRYGNGTRKQDNTYTVVTSFSRSAAAGNATNDTNVANIPITVNVFSANRNEKNDRSNITQNDEKTANYSKIVTISRTDAQATNMTNKINPVNNSLAVLSAFFPVIHASMIATTNNTAHRGKVGSNTDRDHRNDTKNDTIKNYNKTINNSSLPMHSKLSNATKANKTTTSGKMVNYTSVMKDSENNTQAISTRNDTKLVNMRNDTKLVNTRNDTKLVNMRNDTKLTNNSVSAKFFQNTHGGKGPLKNGTKNETDSGNMGNYTNTMKSFRNDTATNGTATTPIPIPITNPITNTITNMVTNEVVNPFATPDSPPPISKEQTNITKIKTSNSEPVDNSTISFPDSSPIMAEPKETKGFDNGTSNLIKANNTNVTNTSKDNVVTSNATKLVNNSVSGNDFPIIGETGNLAKAVTNKTKPVNGSVSMEASAPIRKERNVTNVVTNNTNPVNTSVSGNDSPFVYEVRKATYTTTNNSNPVNSSVLTNASPITHDVRNATNVSTKNSYRKNNFVATNTFPIYHEARKNITTNNNKSVNNSVIQNVSPFTTGRRNMTDVNNRTKMNYTAMMKTARNATKTRSIKKEDVTEFTEAHDLDSRPVHHVTVIKATESAAHKNNVATPESEMMDANTVHPTALMEYYELRDDGSETCEGRTDGTYAIKDVTKYLLCTNQNVLIIPCEGDLVYDVNVQRCTPRSNVNYDRFCRFRGDGTWDSPWNIRITIQCSKGFMVSESCKHDLRYDPELKDCVEETLIIRCFALDRDYTNAKLGCYKKGNLKMDMLINDLPGSKGKHILDWSKFADSVESLVCRCSKAAFEKGYPFFAIRKWAECWAGKNRTELESLMSDESQKNEQFCYSNISIAAFVKCTDNDTRVCVGSEHGQYLYNIVNVTDVNMGATPNKQNKAASRSQINNQVDFIDLVTLTELQKIEMTGKLHLIDVREGFEYDDIGSIKDSINIPLKDLAKALLLPDKAFKAKYGITKPLKDDCNIVFLCSSGVRSDMAYKIAKDIGYKCPKSLKGGYDLLPKIPVPVKK